jgi:mannose-1-phosphate guanylyltransferase/mannose-6-phosphate isomerase
MIPVILSGGNGTRLWPLSRKNKPKQFVELLNGSSLFTETVKRFSNRALFQLPLILGNINHEIFIREELIKNQLEESLVLLEPMVRNTAPAIVSAVIYLQSIGRGDEMVVFLPADAYLDDAEQLSSHLQEGEQLAMANKIVCFGIKPTYPEIGYGYVKIRKKIVANGYEVDKFVEKPTLEMAMDFLRTGRYFWNSGIFMGKVSLLMQLLQEYSNDIYTPVQKAVEHMKRRDNWYYIDGEYFSQSPNISFDYALMEKLNSKKLALVAMNILWSDVGSYRSLFAIDSHKTSTNNKITGQVILHNVNDCYLRSKNKMLCCCDVEDLVVVEEDNVILIMRKNKSQNIRKLITLLEQQQPELL